MKATKVPEKSPVNRQPTKLMSSLKRIANIDLSDEKVKLFENSRFASLISITNARESSSTLVEALALSYSSEKQSFLINEEKFSFCPKEVADVLGISILDTETDYDVFKEKSKQFSGIYPDSLYKLHEEINQKPKKQMTTEDLKELVVKMSVEEEQNKTLFVQLLSYYYVERFLLCSSDHHPRKTLWNFVCDMKAFDSVNWAKEIHAQLMKSISALHGHLKFGDHKKQFNFQGCTPVLEAILFERMPKLCPNVKTLEPPLVQKYCSVRKTIGDWKKSFLTCEVNAGIDC